MIFFNRLSGQAFELAPWPILAFFVRMAIVGPVIGAGIGYALIHVFRRMAVKNDQHHVLIQTCMLIITGYISFVTAESLVGTSGVLTSVATAIVFAKDRRTSTIDR